MKFQITLMILLALFFFAGIVNAQEKLKSWQLHVIDNSSRGADGVRFADINHDGNLDIVTGWEEGGLVRVYLQPDHSKIKQKWPAVTVGKVKTPEDAFFVDVNLDGRLDVVSCCESTEQTIFVHYAPADKSQLLNEKLWKTAPIQSSLKQTRWMFGLPVNLDKDPAMELLCGSKNPRGSICWFDWSKQNSIQQATKHSICKAAWIMSVIMIDLNQDGNKDLIYSDRKGNHRGCWYRINPADGSTPEKWTEHLIGGRGKEVMFLSQADFNADGYPDILCPIRDNEYLLFQNDIRNNEKNKTQKRRNFKTITIPFPENVGAGKSSVIADIDLDGKLDLIATCGRAKEKHGAFWMKIDSLLSPGEISFYPISGTKPGSKYDLVKLLDLDKDGDLDLITCEESDNLGVIWYENPTR